MGLPQVPLGGPSSPCAQGPLPRLEHCKKSKRGGLREREGGEGMAVARGKGPPVAMGGWGGPSKGQLGPDPHRGALDMIIILV